MKSQFLIAASLGILLTACGSVPFRPYGVKNLDGGFSVGSATLKTENGATTVADIKAWTGQAVTLTPESAASGAALAALGKMTIDAQGKGQLNIDAAKLADSDLDNNLLAHTKSVFNRNFVSISCNLNNLSATAADGKGLGVQLFSSDRATLALSNTTAEKVVLFYSDKDNHIKGNPECLGATVDLKLSKGWTYATISDKGLHTIPDPQKLLLVK